MKVSQQMNRGQRPERGQGIHPTAIVHETTVLGKNVSIGAYSIIYAGVTLGDDTEIMNHVTIHGVTHIGKGNRFYPYCAIGLDPQDKKYNFQGKSELHIGDNNVFREAVTLHRGTAIENGVTRIGDGKLDFGLLPYCPRLHRGKTLPYSPTPPLWEDA